MKEGDEWLVIADAGGPILDNDWREGRKETP